MQKFESKSYVRDVLTSTTCNKCGTVVGNDPMVHPQPLHVYHAYGYASKHDLTEVEFDICDDCLDEFMNSFIVPPKKNDRVEL